MHKYDIVVIGSGLGGLVCGAILSKEGYNVCIIEQHFQLGGCIQSFKRDGCVFDAGAHYVGGFEPDQNLYQFFNYLGIAKKLKVKKLNNDCFDKVVFNNVEEYNFSQGYENFIETLSKSFPKEKKEIRDYIKKIKSISNEFPLYNLKEVEKPLIESLTHTETINSVLESITKNHKLQNVLLGTNSLYVGIKNKSPFYIHALINNSYIESAYRFTDGSNQVAELLAEEIIKNGGTILKNTKAIKFNFENNIISSIETKTKEQIFSNNFISNMHPVKTLEMIPPEKIRRIYRNRINSLENTIGMFSVYIVFKKNTFKYINHNLYMYKGSNVYTSEKYSPENFPEHCVLLTPHSSSSNEFAENMIIMSYMKYDELIKWENTTIEKRGKEYEEFKRKKAEDLIKFAEKYFLNLISSIKNYYTSTPLSYRDYTGTEKGSLYGIERNANEAVKSIIFPKTYIPNLFFTGQNINLHGVLGVTVGGILTSAEFTGLNYLIKKINSNK